ncbi:MAG: IS200/IS605 family element transposase accessory protein TnpB [Lachnospiraceae bacterium]|nr:IS200/IS605 family element transposase accessory protein TnpB [Lachnospiraceae bacterium]
MIQKAFKYRIYPTRAQREVISRIFGCVRFVFNFFLAMRKQEYTLNYATVSYNRCSSELTKLKQESDYAWLNEADSTALQSSLRDLSDAFQNMFEHRSGYPKFKSKRDHYQSYTSKNNNNSIRLTDKAVKLPKLGFVKAKVSRPAEGRILSATVEHTPSGKYYVSVLCECEEPEKLSGGDAVGIDLGLSDFAVLSDGLGHIPNPEPLAKLLKKLKHEQRLLSRKTKGSHRYEVQRLKVARLHERISSFRNDHHQKLSTELVRKYRFIGTEDLDVRQLLSENRSEDSRRISDSGWRSFVSMLSYKAEWYGRTLVKVGRHYPSSQLCHDCGYQYPAVRECRLKVWTCPQCGKIHQRDENAALNIRDEALRIYAAV